MDGQNQDKTGQDTHTDTDTHTHKAEQDYTQYYEACKRRITETDYHRGLSADVLERHWIGYEPEFKTKDQDTGEFTAWRALSQSAWGGRGTRLPRPPLQMLTSPALSSQAAQRGEVL